MMYPEWTEEEVQIIDDLEGEIEIIIIDFIEGEILTKMRISKIRDTIKGTITTLIIEWGIMRLDNKNITFNRIGTEEIVGGVIITEDLLETNLILIITRTIEETTISLIEILDYISPTYILLLLIMN